MDLQNLMLSHDYSSGIQIAGPPKIIGRNLQNLIQSHDYSLQNQSDELINRGLQNLILSHRYGDGFRFEGPASTKIFLTNLDLCIGTSGIMCDMLCQQGSSQCLGGLVMLVWSERFKEKDRLNLKSNL